MHGGPAVQCCPPCNTTHVLWSRRLGPHIERCAVLGGARSRRRSCTAPKCLLLSVALAFWLAPKAYVRTAVYRYTRTPQCDKVCRATYAHHVVMPYGSAGIHRDGCKLLYLVQALFAPCYRRLHSIGFEVTCLRQTVHMDKQGHTGMHARAAGQLACRQCGIFHQTRA